MLCTQFRVKCPTVFENSVTARHCFVTEDANVMKLIFIAARSLGKLWHGVFATGYPQAILGFYMLQHFSSAKTKISQLKRHLLMDERVKSFELRWVESEESGSGRDLLLLIQPLLFDLTWRIPQVCL